MELSRRSFVQGAALSAAAVGSAGLVGRVTAEEATEYAPSERCG